MSRILTDFMQPQQESNWCWAAVGTSVGLFLETGSWTQCDTANACLGETDCCTTPAVCNVYGYLENSLDYTNSLASTTSTCTAAQLETEINAGHPVCARVAWFTNGAHFMAMTGYSYPSTSPATVTVYLQDSIYGDTSMLFADFARHYQSGGRWTTTYFTAPQP
ncbi:MAG TPA: papain-like cysteine protease family protein [Longimicrobium sp.]|nr:papain-like cysteine protease family protein [Longimicrobium sp.]